MLSLLLVGCPAGDENPAPPVASETGGGVDSGGIAPDVTAPDPDAPDAGPGEPEVIVNPPCVLGLSCSDDNPCTLEDKCLPDPESGLGGSCEGTPYTCDDGRECTENNCDEKGGCEYPVISGFCLLNNVCVDHGTSNPGNECERCDTDLDKIGWSARAELEPCEDGNPCTFGDYCKKGDCRAGLKATCDDDNECTLDGCNKVVGCINEPASGPCDDGDPCTNASVCSGGVCFAPAGECDDGLECTTDTCLPELGCEFVPTQGPCDDDDACTEGDACVEGACQAGPAADCSDGTECTEDECDALFGCYYTLTADPCCSGAVHVCDDGNPCTTDSCVAGGGGGGCQNTVNTLPCEDGDQCTAGDKCQGGDCIAGAAPPCDDGNACTQDSCNEASGCQYAPIFGSCSDGIACTTGDSCVGGQCVGDTSQCKCDPDFSNAVAKATSLVIGTTGNPGDGLDVDQNAGTCAPVDKCSGGVDNTLAPLASFVNTNLEKEIANGGLILLIELVNPTTNGSPFELRLYAAKLANKSCDHTQSGCDYLVDDATLTEDCEALIVLDNATITGGKLSAGGPGYNFPLQIPLFGDTYLVVDLFNGAIEGDITLTPQGTITSITNGLVGGAIPKSTFISAIELVPPSDLPAPKETIVQLLDLLVKNDMDTVPPAGPDAASIGIKLTAVGGTIVGVAD